MIAVLLMRLRVLQPQMDEGQTQHVMVNVVEKVFILRRLFLEI